MNTELQSNKYIVKRNFISKNEAKKLAELFSNFAEENPKEKGDSLCPNTFSHYNFFHFLGFSLDKLSEIETIVEEKLFPTYTFARLYKTGDDLRPHRDREACEISITLNLDCDRSWDIWFAPDERGVEDPEYRIYISLEPGDAIIYKGCEIKHGRDPLEGKYCTQLFLHYVQRNGPYNFYYFDHYAFCSGIRTQMRFG